MHSADRMSTPFKNTTVHCSLFVYDVFRQPIQDFEISDLSIMKCEIYLI